MFQTPTQPLSIWATFTRSFSLYKASFKKGTPWFVILLIVLGVRFFFELLLKSAPQLTEAEQFTVLGITMIISIFLSLCLSTLLYQINDILHGQNNKFGYILKRGFTRGLILLVTYIVLILLLVIVSVVLFKLLGFFQADAASSGHAWLVALILIALSCFWVTFLAWFPLIIITKLNPWQAFKLSFKLMKGHWWQTVGLIILVAIVAITLYIIAMALLALLWLLHIGFISILLPLGVGAFFVIPWVISVLLLQVNNLQLAHQAN